MNEDCDGGLGNVRSRHIRCIVLEAEMTELVSDFNMFISLDAFDFRKLGQLIDIHK